MKRIVRTRPSITDAARALLNALLLLVSLAVCHPARAQSPNDGSNIFDATLAPYNADKSGATDAAPALNHAVSDATAWSSANNAPVVVQLDAGTYLLQSSPISISNEANTLTITGHSSGDTFLTYTRTQNPAVLDMESNPGTVVVENFTEDVSDPTQLAFTQGTITAFDRKASTVTVQAESGYPLLNRPDIVADPSGDYRSFTLYTFSDPKRLIWDHPLPNMQSITPSADGTTAVIKVDQVPSFTYVGEAWAIMTDTEFSKNGVSTILAYDNNVTLQNINYYGGNMERAAGNGSYNTGNVSLTNYYQGPPPTPAQATSTWPARFLPDRRITGIEGFQSQTRGTFSVINCNMSGGWDDVLDLGGDYTQILSQSAPNTNQIHLSSAGPFGTLLYQQGDLVELSLSNTSGTVYATATITGATNFVNSQGQQDGSLILTLSNNVTVQNPGSDLCCDMTFAGAITLQNSSFSSGIGHVFLHGGGVGTGTTVTGCLFHDMCDNGLEVVGAPKYGQGPGDAHNVLIQNSTFERCQNAGVLIQEGSAVTGSAVKILNNTFLDTGSAPNEACYAGCAILLDNVNGATISGNWFDRNWGSNVCAEYDDNLVITNNTFNHPNFIRPPIAPSYTGQPEGSTNPFIAPDSTSAVFLSNDAGVTLSGNIVSGAGPYTKSLVEVDTAVTNATGLADGITQIDSPLAFYLAYDKLVMDQPASGTILDQAAWTGAATQKWIAQPSQSAPGYATLTDDSTGQFVGNANSKALRASIDIESQAWTLNTDNPATDQMWNFAVTSASADNILNGLSAYDINVGMTSKATGAKLLQWYPDAYFKSKGQSSQVNQDFIVLSPPAPLAAGGFESASLTWAPVPGAAGYTISRSAAAAGPFASVGSVGTTLPLAFTDASAAPGLPSYYTVAATGTPLGTLASTPAAASVGTTAINVPVDLAPAFNVTGIEPDAWTYLGPGFDGYGYTYSSSLVPALVSWSGNLFSLGPAAKPDAVADAGQRIDLPTGNFSSLLILGSYLGGGPSATGTFMPTLTYADGTSAVLSQGMANWCGSASQPGESNVVTASYRNLGTGAKQTYTNYVHGYQIPIDPTRQTQWLDLPSTGQFRLLAMDLDNTATSVMEEGQLLQQGQYLVSPTGKCYLTQQSDGNLVIYAGSGPASKGAFIWNSGYYNPGGGPYFTLMQTDGNLVTYVGTPAAPNYNVWASQTYSNKINGNVYLQLTDSGHVQLLQQNAPAWDDGVNVQASTLPQGQSLGVGETLTSPQGGYFLTQLSSGDLALYAGTPASPGALAWDSQGSGSGTAFYTEMQPDGNLVTYQGTAGVTPQTPQYVVWASATYGHPGSYLSVTDAPEVQVVNNGNTVWQKP